MDTKIKFTSWPLSDQYYLDFVSFGRVKHLKHVQNMVNGNDMDKSQRSYNYLCLLRVHVHWKSYPISSYKGYFYSHSYILCIVVYFKSIMLFIYCVIIIFSLTSPTPGYRPLSSCATLHGLMQMHIWTMWFSVMLNEKWTELELNYVDWRFFMITIQWTWNIIVCKEGSVKSKKTSACLYVKA